MRVLPIATTAILITSLLGCSAELVQRPPAADPTSVASTEAPAPTTPAYAPDPLLTLPAAATHPGHQPAASFTCPMHPEVTQAAPGDCPKCGMALVPKDGGR